MQTVFSLYPPGAVRDHYEQESANQVYYAMSLRIMTLCRSLPASSNED